MKKIFLDSSVLVAASASTRGASALILGLSRQKKIQTYISPDVIGEARRNINIKLGSLGRKRLIYYLKYANLVFTPTPSVEDIAICEKFINEKDAPILAAAIKSPASYLITLDKKHFLQTKVIKYVKPLIITTPGDFVVNFLKTENL